MTRIEQTFKTADGKVYTVGVDVSGEGDHHETAMLMFRRVIQDEAQMFGDTLIHRREVPTPTEARNP